MVVVYGLWPLCLLDVDAFDGVGVVVFVVIVTALLQASQRVLDPLPVFHSRMNRNLVLTLLDQCDKLFEGQCFESAWVLLCLALRRITLMCLVLRRLALRRLG